MDKLWIKLFELFFLCIIQKRKEEFFDALDNYYKKIHLMQSDNVAIGIIKVDLNYFIPTIYAVSIVI